MVGKNALIIQDFNRPVDVTGYDPTLGVKRSLRTVSAALAYDDPSDGHTVILVIHQAIHVPTMSHNLITPMQLRMNDVQVREIPRFLTDHSDADSHSILIPDPDGGNPYKIPLSLHGIVSFFPTRRPTPQEFGSSSDRYELTYETPAWDPNSNEFELQETHAQGHPIPIPGIGDNGRLRLSAISRPNPCFERDNPLPTAASNLSDEFILDNLNSIQSISTTRRRGTQPGQLATRWGIGVDTARRTIDATTQRGVRTVSHPSLSRRFRTNDRQLRYRRLTATVYSDTLISKVKSKRGNSYAQVFATKFGWCRVFPMRLKSEAHHALSLLFARDGVPPTIVVDGSKEQTQGKFRHKARQADCHLRAVEPHSPWSNAAEAAIRELKRGAGRKMVKSGAPRRLWDYCLELEALIRSNTALDIFELRGQVPETVMSGETSDISPFVEFEWYQWVMFRDTGVSYPHDREVLGRYLGPSVDVGPAMTAQILKSNGWVVHRSTYRALTNDEWEEPHQVRKRAEFDTDVSKKLGVGYDHDREADAEDSPDVIERTPVHTLHEEEALRDEATSGCGTREPPSEPSSSMGDQYIGAEVQLPLGGSVSQGRVRKRKSHPDGSDLGTANANPILDTRVYEVEFESGATADFAANIIAENMWSQCDSEGQQFVLLDEVIDHRKTTTTTPGDHSDTGCAKPKSTRGWQMCVRWKDGSTTWEPLSRLKESNPVEIAEYATAKGLQGEPAFAWWVPYTIKKRDRIVAAVNKRYHKRTHKFGIQVPKTVDEALQLDKVNGNTLWADAIRKEMDAVRVAFKVLDSDEAVPATFQQIRCHMIFDVKMEDFRRKARYVAGGHTTETPATLTYASVVSRESVRIALTMAALHGLEVKTGDIKNAYLTAPVSEKIWTTCGPEFGQDQGKRAIIVRSLYGLKSAGASFRNHLADCMRSLGYTACLADQDVWYKAETRPDGFKYYAYVLLYVDDALSIHHDGTEVLKQIDFFFRMKPGSIGDPDMYLGGKLRQTRLANGVDAWGLSSSKYVQEAVRNVEKFLSERKGGRKLPRRAATPFERDYRPETDESPELRHEDASFYQSQIGVLRWMVEMGRIDIITEVSLLASHLTLPREGHLDAVLHVYAYLRKKHNARIVFDPSYPPIDMTAFKECNWKEFYGDVVEATPPNAPEARGKEVDLRVFVDSDHAGEHATRRSRTGYLVYMNMSPIAWYSKRQATVETSVFGAEFVAMKTAMDTARGIRYKLRMMGIPLSGPTYFYGDNMSVIHNTQRPESQLRKKANAICYHAIRESVAMGEMLTGHIRSENNPADLCTKVIPGGQKRTHLLNLIMYDLADYD